jgi:hypothetical protein
MKTLALIMLVVSAALLFSSTVSGQAWWDIEYDGSVKPVEADPQWTDEGSIRDSLLPEGKYRLIDSTTSYAAIWKIGSLLDTIFTYEVRVKVVDLSSTSYVPLVYARPENMGSMNLVLKTDSIVLQANSGSNWNAAPFVTTDGFHRYRVISRPDSIYLFADGNLAIATENDVSEAGDFFWWGSIYNAGQSTVDWDYIRIDTCERVFPLSNCDSVSAIDQPFSPDDCAIFLGHLDEAEGDVVHDESFHENHGVRYGAEWVEGMFGSGLQFDGDSVKVPLDDSTFTAGSHTVEAWIKLDQVGSWQTVISLPGYQQQIPIYVHPDNRVSFRAVLNASNWTEIKGNTVLEAGQWYHVAGRWNADSSEIAVFVNGIKDASEILTFVPGPLQASWFEVGMVTTGSGGGKDPSHFFHGVIDELRISNIARQFEPLPDTDQDGIPDVFDECTDTDGDGYGNPGFSANTCETDNCPSVYNPDQLNSDPDSVGDVCDNCPFAYNPVQEDADSNGIGDFCEVLDSLILGRSTYETALYKKTMYFPVYLNNQQPIKAGRFPLEYNWPFDPDSVSFVCTRTSYMDQKLGTINLASKIIDISFIANVGPGNNPLAPIDEYSVDTAIARIYFTIPCVVENVCDSLWILPPDTTTLCTGEDCFSIALVDTSNIKLRPDIGFDSILVEQYRPGDANGECTRDIDDIVFLITYVFAGGLEPVCYKSGDANGSCDIDIDDIVYMINYVFVGGEPPLPYCYTPDCDEQSLLAKTVADNVSLILKCGGSAVSFGLTSGLDVQGLQLEFETSGDILNLTASSAIEGIQVFSGWVDRRFKVGLLDMQGQVMIPAGKSDILTLSYSGDGGIELVKTIAVAKGGGRLDVTTRKEASEAALPRDFSLEQNHPNPFNPSTEISFSLPVTSQVRLDVYNIMGQKVTTLVNGSLPAGKHSVIWDGKSLSGETVASGVYFYRIEAANFTDAKKMLLMK